MPQFCGVVKGSGGTRGWGGSLLMGRCKEPYNYLNYIILYIKPLHYQVTE